MADVRCPMCGKPNAADRDVCQYCQARLKPVWLGGDAPDSGSGKKEELPDWLQLGQDAAQPGQQAPESDETDWLKSIIGSSADYVPSGPDSNRVESEAQDDLDWLSRIGGEAETPAEPTSGREQKPPAPQREASEFDWLRGGAEESPDRDEGAAPLLSDDDLPDWLKSSTGPAAGQASSQADSGLPEWLSGASLPAPQSPPPPAPQMDLPDWLTGSSGSTPAEEFPAGDLDWMAPGRGAAPAVEQFDLSTDAGLPDWLTSGSKQADEVPDWMKPSGSSVAGPAQPAASPEAELPDWLTGTGGQVDEIPDWMSQSDSPTTGPAQPAASPEAELPDWLTGSKTPSAGEPAADEFDWLKSADQAAPAQESFGQADDSGVSDWFTPAEDQPAVQEPAQSAAADLPDWLAGVDAVSADKSDWLQSGTSAPPSTPGGVEQFELSGDTDLPDWMMADQQTPATPAAPASSPAEQGMASPTDETPDWMFDMMGAQAGEEPAAPRPADEPEWLSGESLDWLAAEMHSGETGGAPADAGDSKRGAPPFGSSALEGDLSWLEDVSPASPAAPASFGDEAGQFGVSSDDLGVFPHDRALPAWLHAEQPETPSEPAAGEVNEADLRPAELPTWLQAMRPVGTVNAAEGVEGESPLVAGPLAGLRGVLPAEVDIAQVRKPPLYSPHLEVTDQQQAHMDLLQSLMAAEGVSRPVPAKPAITSLAVLRLAAAVLLIVSILLSLLTGFPSGGLPSLTDTAIPAVQLVDGLAADVPVLFAVDYEPGVSAEMDALAGSVLEHLIKKGAYVTMVSTVPTGAVQAERLANQARTAKGLPFNSPEDYANLGYISGGAAGLLGFAEAPQRVMPVDLRGQRVWGLGPLQGVAKLGNFRLIVIASENPETVRAWVEQVGTQSNMSAPMVALVSAQAEPMVRPYADANPPQLAGIVSGLLGAAAYDGAVGQNGPAVGYWNPFSFGMLVSALLALVVILFNLVSARLSRRKQSAGSEGKA